MGQIWLLIERDWCYTHTHFHKVLQNIYKKLAKLRHSAGQRLWMPLAYLLAIRSYKTGI